MTTSYPGAVDNLTNPTPSDTLNSATVPHAAQHANANDAIEAIQTTLGTNPQGTSSTVKDRITAAEGAIINLNLAVDERVPGEAGSNQPAGARPNGYIWVNTTDNSIKVWNGTQYVDPSNAGSGGPSWAVASGGTETTITEGGKTWKVHTFTANGTLTVTAEGLADVLIVGAGTAGDASGVGGGAGLVVDGWRTLAAGPHAVVVGAAGAWAANAGQSSLAGVGIAPGGVGDFSGQSGGCRGVVSGADGGGGARGPKVGGTGGPGVVSAISGTSVEYARGGNVSASGGPTSYGSGGSAGAGRPGVVIVRYQV